MDYRRPHQYMIFKHEFREFEEDLELYGSAAKHSYNNYPYFNEDDASHHAYTDYIDTVDKLIGEKYLRLFNYIYLKDPTNKLTNRNMLPNDILYNNHEHARSVVRYIIKRQLLYLIDKIYVEIEVLRNKDSSDKTESEIFNKYQIIHKIKTFRKKPLVHLNFSEYIKSIKYTPSNFEIFQNLVELDVSNSGITSLEGLPQKLVRLNVSGNRITSLVSKKGRSLLPEELSFLNISNNGLSNFEGLPPTLMALDISFNKITKLKGLPRVYYLEIHHNKIKSLEGLGVVPNLRKLRIYNNKISSLVSRSGKILLPTTLIELDISHNSLTSIQGLPRNLEKLSINDNHITSVPIQIVHLRNLTKFSYFGNPIEIGDSHPSVTRFLNSLRNRDTRSGCTIYDNGQNVHDLTVQNSIRESLNRLVEYTQLITKSKLSDEEISFLNSEEVHSFFGFTQREVLVFIENAIVNSPHGYKDETKEQLYSLLKEALHEGKSVCSTGRIGRMVNVLSGFDPNVQIKISDNSQIGAIISTFRSRGERKEKVEEELLSRGIEKKEIDTWLEYY
jgi:Leucine-rich repeat (LRR) protein